VTDQPDNQIRKTALNDEHRRSGAKMVEFGGWDMPVEYKAGLVAEHKVVREAAGLFDVSHMGCLRLSGPEALAAVQRMTMNDAAKLAIGQAQYSALLYENGTFVDDVLTHKLGEEDYLLVINAGTREKDSNWVREAAKGFDCKFEDLSDAYTQIAIQGPKAVDVVQKLTDVDLATVKFYHFTHGKFCGLDNVMIARTGYTAEDGFEVYVPADVATSERVWRELLAAGAEFGVLACGLGARNTLRLEGCLSLYGHEISDQITVWEAGLDRFIKMDKGEFTGRAALEQQKAAGLKRKLVGLVAEGRGIPRDGYKVNDAEGKEIGVVTSGSPAPTLGMNIALAYVPTALAEVGTKVFVDIRGRQVECRVEATPFYKRPRKQK